MQYNPEVFAVRTINDAKSIILTNEGGLTTDERWALETPYLAEMIIEHLHPREGQRVLDYGCGIGRMAKELITRTGCMVVGVDTETSMRSLAPAYVQSVRFLACHPDMLWLFEGFHAAVAIWALQHIPNLDETVELLRHEIVSDDGKLFVVNMNHRAVPMDDGSWFDDGVDVRANLSEYFHELECGTLDASRTTDQTAKQSFWGVYQPR